MSVAAAPTAPGHARTVVVKIGSSSVTTDAGRVDGDAIDKLSGEVAGARAEGLRVVVVTSGAIAAGWTSLSGSQPRPSDLATLQAVAAVGQHLLMRVWSDALGRHGLTAGQVLLAPLDFVHRSQYLLARQTLTRLLELGVVPVVNENDAVADEEIRFGDNDRLAALVAHLVGAGLLLLLTDTAGLLTEDPRRTDAGSLIEEVVEIDHELERIAGGPGSEVGSGGMGSKLAAAKIAVWSGVEAVIADAARPAVLGAVLESAAAVGTRFRPRDRRLPARKLWIAFAIGSSGTIVVDEGARRALVERGRSLLPAGVLSVRGDFGADDAVEIAGPDGVVFAKGLVRQSTRPVVAAWAGRHSDELPEDVAAEVVHRDDLVVLVTPAVNRVAARPTAGTARAWSGDGAGKYADTVPSSPPTPRWPTWAVAPRRPAAWLARASSAARDEALLPGRRPARGADRPDPRGQRRRPDRAERPGPIPPRSTACASTRAGCPAWPAASARSPRCPTRWARWSRAGCDRTGYGSSGSGCPWG